MSLDPRDMESAESTEALEGELPDCGEGLRQAEVELTLRILLSPEKLVKGMGESAPRDTYDLIIGLEQEVGWWALTVLLARYFEGQMAVAREKCPELVGKTDGELMVELEECE